MSREDVDIDVIDEGKKGFLGLFGATRAIVKVREKNTGQDEFVEETSHLTKKNTEEAETPSLNIQEVELFLNDIAHNMEVEDEVDTNIENNQVTFDLSGEQIAI